MRGYQCRIVRCEFWQLLRHDASWVFHAFSCSVHPLLPAQIWVHMTALFRQLRWQQLFCRMLPWLSWLSCLFSCREYDYSPMRREAVPVNLGLGTFKSFLTKRKTAKSDVRHIGNSYPFNCEHIHIPYNPIGPNS